MEAVYELQNDSATIASMQRGSREARPPVGLRATHGLIGSKEWWDNIKSGALKLHALSGLVSGFWPGQGGGGPAEFELRAADGTKSMWLCEMEPAAAERAFRLGRPVLVEFVLQELLFPLKGAHETKITVSISLGFAATPLSFGVRP